MAEPAEVSRRANRPPARATFQPNLEALRYENRLYAVVAASTLVSAASQRMSQSRRDRQADARQRDNAGDCWRMLGVDR